MAVDDEFLAEVLGEFFDECEELLVSVDIDLVALEESFSPELLSSAFRALHTIKGSAGFLGLTAVELAAHEGEEILSRVRAGDLEVTAAVVDQVLQCVDRVREQVALVQTGVVPPSGDVALPADSVASPPASSSTAQVAQGIPGEGAVTLPSAEVAAEPGSSAPEPRPAGEPPLPAAGAQGAAKLDEKETVRVDVAVLDRLVTTVAELSLARNRIRTRVGDERLREVNVLLAELQDAVIRTRMQPLNTLFSKVPRTVRDLARSLGKDIHLEMTGGEIEIDRALLDVVRDPLNHVLRNAVDHGIELPAARLAAGKDPVGVITLRARHEAGLVVISVHDDGAGVDLDGVRAHAEQLGKQVPDDALEAIFLPGLSTSPEVTLVSGRGVGMDVVQRNLTSVGGQVAVKSAPGRGTTVTFRVPLTIALLPALLVSSAGQQFMLPQAHVSELVRVTPEDVVQVGPARMLDVHGTLVDVLTLADLLELHTSPGQSPEAQGTFGVLVTDGHRRAILAVDDVCGGDGIVVKPLDSGVLGCQAYVGAAILDHGEPRLVLDVPRLISTVSPLLPRDSRAQDEPEDASSTGTLRVLVVQTHQGESLALPACSVERVEVLERDSIHVVDSQTLASWRGSLLPLVGSLPESSLPCSGVVVRDSHGTVSLMLAARDVLEIADAVELPVISPGDLSTLRAVSVDGAVARLVDPGALASMGYLPSAVSDG